MAVDDLERLVSGMGGFLARLARGVRRGATLVAVLAAVLGLTALLLGLWAWHDSPGAAVVVALLCVPAIAAPVFVIRRLRPLTDAVSRPDETARQARTYFAGLRSTPELDQLISEAAAMQKASGGIRLRRGVRSLRLVSSLVESAAPDPRTQPLVAAFQPSRLRGVWLGVLASWWLAIAASVLAVVAIASLIVDAIAG